MPIDAKTATIYPLLNNANYNYRPDSAPRSLHTGHAIRVIYRKSSSVIPLSSSGHNYPAYRVLPIAAIAGASQIARLNATRRCPGKSGGFGYTAKEEEKERAGIRESIEEIRFISENTIIRFPSFSSTLFLARLDVHVWCT